MAPTAGRGPSATARESGVATVEKTLAILEAVAERGGATAREVSDALGYPIPTVYRLLQALVQSDYLVHLAGEHRFELGYKLDRLGVSLHRQVGIPTSVRAEVSRLHSLTQTAAYFASTAEPTSSSPTSPTSPTSSTRRRTRGSPR